MFLIDFDDTLFDTYAFKQARLEAVRKIGVSDELWAITYGRARTNENGHMMYSDKIHAQILSEYNFSLAEIFSALQTVTKTCGRFLFSDTIEFLQTLQKYRHPLILLSLGEVDFQEAKIRGAGIQDYFDRLFMVPDSKVRVINELARTTNVTGWLINDKIAETKEIINAHPDLNCVLKISPKFPLVDYETSGQPFFPKLSEIAKYIQNN